MEDISNRALAILLAAAIAISLFSIFTQSPNSITGLATNRTSGMANVTIQSTIQINLNNATVDFGVGFVNGSGDYCNLTSNFSSKIGACQGFNAPAIDPYFVVENTGSVNITLRMNSSYANARSFLCNSTHPTQNCTFYQPLYDYGVSELETGSCTSADFPGFGGSKMNGTLQVLCSNLNFDSTKNTLAVPLRMVIPRDSRQGQLTDSVLFQAD